jgi:hypothetical protein
MAGELDHFFILTSPGAPEAESLLRLGLLEGPSNAHRGQGTANRRFFFADAMLELLYVDNPAEAMHGSGRRLRLAERWSGEGASPFGLVLCVEPESSGLPFTGWPYRPAYLGGDKPFLIGENSDSLNEPLCIISPMARQSGVGKTHSRDPFRHVSELVISVPVERPSLVLRALATLPRLTFRLGAPHLMEVVFQQGKRGERADLRPELPLVLSW